MNTRTIDTARGLRVAVHEAGRGAPLVFLHGAGGLLADNPFLDELAARYHVLAPEWPGYGESGGEEQLEDMLDFALHGWDVVAALGLERPHLVGHSMGGMIAAEMAALAPNEIERLCLVASAGLWLDQHPLPDLFALLPQELPGYLFHDVERGSKLMAPGGDINDVKFLAEFMVMNARRLGMAGKMLFPIPDRGLSDRLYRIKARTLIVWGEIDKLIPLPYAEAFRSAIADARVVTIPEAGHLVGHEKPEAVLRALATLN